MPAINYFTVGSNKLEQAKVFYDALLGSIGMSPAFEHPSGGRLYRGKGIGMFGVLGPYDGNPATVGNGTMVALEAKDQAQVDRVHAIALEHGGSDEGAPGLRGGGFYGAYFRDPDGNKLNAYCMPETKGE